ncbi:MAG: hypothetical protein ACYC4E_02810 [Carboxydocellales bacterium]
MKKIQFKKPKVMPITVILLLSGLLVSGCTNMGSQGDKSSKRDQAQYELWLKEDANNGFDDALSRDYRRLTIISGSLNKLRSSDHPELTLGTVLGATESTIYIKESEYKRLDNNFNISGEMKKAIAPAGILNILNKNQKILEHVYKDILKPYADKLVMKQALTVQQEKSLDQTIDLIQGITQTYSRLSQNHKDMSVEEVETLVRDLDKLQNQLGSVYFPLK